MKRIAAIVFILCFIASLSISPWFIVGSAITLYHTLSYVADFFFTEELNLKEGIMPVDHVKTLSDLLQKDFPEAYKSIKIGKPVTHRDTREILMFTTGFIRGLQMEGGTVPPKMQYNLTWERVANLLLGT